MSAIRAIEAVLQAYFDGLHEGDTGKLAAVFHEVCHLHSLDDDGAVRDVSRAQWLAAVEGRAVPKAAGLPRTDRIVSIDLAGGGIAMAKVECSIHPRYFVDYLTLLETSGLGWQIVAKVFCTETREATPAP